MTNQVLQLKLMNRVNKLASSDYDNLPVWVMVEAFNKSMIEFCRRNLHGGNQYKEGDESSESRIDDLQNLIVSLPLVMSTNPEWDQAPKPQDFLRFKRVSSYAKNECCPARKLVIYHVEEGNIDEILRDKYKQPNFDWAETVSTLKGNQILIYTNNQFTLVNPILTYYRKPINIQIAGSVDPYTGLTSTVDVICEFQDDLVELIIDDTAAQLARDIESSAQAQNNQSTAEQNN